MLKVSFKEIDYQRIMNALRKLDVLAPVIIEDDMQRACATDFYQLVFSNIVTRKYTSTDPRYSKRYAEWKMDNVGHLHPWLLKGDLLEALTGFKSKTGWMGGIPAGVMDSGGKSWRGSLDIGPAKSIAWYGRILEYNRKKPRPVFQPTTEEYARNGWKIQGRNALRQVGNLWR
jgi:hypothetical protein